jgi:hypothetical protein
MFVADLVVERLPALAAAYDVRGDRIAPEKVGGPAAVLAMDSAIAIAIVIIVALRIEGAVGSAEAALAVRQKAVGGKAQVVARLARRHRLMAKIRNACVTYSC